MNNKYISVFARKQILVVLKDLLVNVCQNYSQNDADVLELLESFAESLENYILFIEKVELLTQEMVKKIVDLIYCELYFLEFLISENI